MQAPQGMGFVAPAQFHERDTMESGGELWRDPYAPEPVPAPVATEPEIFGVPLTVAIPGALVAWWVLKG